MIWIQIVWESGIVKYKGTLVPTDFTYKISVALNEDGQYIDRNNFDNLVFVPMLEWLRRVCSVGAT